MPDLHQIADWSLLLQFISSMEHLSQGCFLSVFKKLKAGSKKTQANFWQKTQGYGGNFGYQEKTSIFFDKNIQNSSKSSMKFYSFCEFSKNLSILCGIPTKQRIFRLYYRKSQKKL